MRGLADFVNNFNTDRGLATFFISGPFRTCGVSCGATRIYQIRAVNADETWTEASHEITIHAGGQ